MPDGINNLNATPAAEQSPSPAVVSEQRYTIPVAAEQTAARIYEPGSVADSWHQYFKDLETMGEEWEYETADYWEAEYPSDTVAMRDVMRSVQEKLKASGVISKLKQAAKSGTQVTKGDIEYAFTVYQNAVRDAINRLSELSPQQRATIKSSAQSQFDRGYRDMLIEHIDAAMNGETDLHLSLQDFFLMVNPKAKKIEYMQKTDALKILRHSMSLASTDQIKRDITVIRQHKKSAMVQELEQDDEFKSIESKIVQAT